MKKGIISDFVGVLFFFGADYQQKFKKQFVCKVFTVIALIGLTAVFATLSVHYDVLKFGLNNETNWTALITLLGGIALIILFASGLVALFTGGMILIPSMMMWVYISGKYGSKQHIINVFLFMLCAAFMVYSLNLVNIFEYLSGETYRDTVNNWGKIVETLFGLIVVFGTAGIFGWISGISEAQTYAVKEMIDLETTANSKKQKPTQRKKRKVKS